MKIIKKIKFGLIFKNLNNLIIIYKLNKIKYKYLYSLY